MILVVCAVAAELRGFARPGIAVVAVGVGPVEAALGTTRALASTHYELVVNAGIGGGFAGRAEVGDAVAVTHDQYLELGREDGAQLALPGGIELVATCASDPHRIEQLQGTRQDGALHVGPGLTSATITTSAARAELLAARYAPIVESMEGFAVLRAAEAAGIPAIELRGISNIVGDRATSQWDFRAGSLAAVSVLATLLDVVQGEA